MLTDEAENQYYKAETSDCDGNQCTGRLPEIPSVVTDHHDEPKLKKKKK